MNHGMENEPVDPPGADDSDAGAVASAAGTPGAPTAEPPVPRAAAEVIGLLAARGQSLAVAESLTGGLVAAELTTVPGVSRVFVGSVTAYATRLKRDVLGVDGDLLAARGAVDPRVAEAMAAGVRDRLGADWGLATTGVAGPEPQDGQPVGTVYVALVAPEGAAPHTLALRLAGDRSAIRSATVAAAVDLLNRALTAAAGPFHGEVPENGKTKDTEQHGGF